MHKSQHHSLTSWIIHLNSMRKRRTWTLIAELSTLGVSFQNELIVQIFHAVTHSQITFVIDRRLLLLFCVGFYQNLLCHHDRALRCTLLKTACFHSWNINRVLKMADSADLRNINTALRKIKKKLPADIFLRDEK